MTLPIEKFKTFFSKHPEIHTALIFGSHAKNRVRKSSDLDIALLITPTKKITSHWEYATGIGLKLQDFCHQEVDILILNQASPHIAFRAIKEGKIIFQRPDRSVWNAFVVKTISMNEDMEILYRKVSAWSTHSSKTSD